MKKIFFLVFSFIFLSLLPKKVHSFSYTNLSFNPSSFEITANPGDEVENVIRVQNLGSSSVKLLPVAKNLRLAEEDGAVLISEDSSFYPLAQWTVVLSEEEEILSGETRVFKFKIDIPESAKPGSYFGSVVFGNQQEDIGGSLVFLRVYGPAEEKLKVKDYITFMNSLTLTQK